MFTNNFIKVGVIGLGNMGQHHVRVLSQLGFLHSVYDINTSTAQDVASQYHVHFSSSLEEIIKQNDAIFVATPTSTHFEIAEMAITNEKHVFIEKPITIHVEEAEKLIDMANRYQVLLQVGHIERFNPVLEEMKKIISDKEVISVDIKRLSNYDPRIQDSDVIYDLMIHDIDLLYDLFNESIHVKNALTRHIYNDNYVDHAVLLAETGSGIIITGTASRITEEKIRSISITTLDSYIHADYLTRNIHIHRRTNLITKLGQSVYRQENIVEKVYVPNVEPLYTQNLSFIKSILNKTKPVVGGIDGLRAVKLALDIKEKSMLSTH
jgi:predicted dehydrogenase